MFGKVDLREGLFSITFNKVHEIKTYAYFNFEIIENK